MSSYDDTSGVTFIMNSTHRLHDRIALEASYIHVQRVECTSHCIFQMIDWSDNRSLFCVCVRVRACGRVRGHTEMRAVVTPGGCIIFLATPMARTKQTACRSTKSNFELLEENQMLRGKVNDLEMDIQEMKKRCNCGSLSNSKAKRLKKIEDVMHALNNKRLKKIEDCF